jgi:hypothetical protein
MCELIAFFHFILYLISSTALYFREPELNNCRSETKASFMFNSSESLLWMCSGKCEVCGLGTLHPKKHVFPNTLHCATVPLVQRNWCEKALGPYVSLQPGIVCAGGGDSDACVVSRHCSADAVVK